MDWTLAFIGFVTYIFVITTYQIAIGDVAVVAALLGLLFLKQPVRFPALLAVFGLFIAWCALGIATSAFPEFVREEVIETSKLWLILLVGVNALRTRSQIRLFIVLFLLFYALYPARGTIFNYLWGFKVFGRAVWNFVFRNPNDLAAITLLQFSMAVGLLKTEPPGWFKRGALAATIVLPIVIILTQSRGVFLALLVIAALAFYKEIRRLKSALLMVVMVGAVALAAPSSVWERFGNMRSLANTENLLEAEDEGSAAQRFEIWQVSWKIIADHPLTGVGLGTYGDAHAEYAMANPQFRLAGGRRDTHSTYFNIAAVAGIPGLMLFLAMMGMCLLHAERIRRRCARVLPGAAQQLYFLELGLIGFLLSGIFASYGRISFLYIHLALIYVVAKACENDLGRLVGAGGVERQTRSPRS